MQPPPRSATWPGVVVVRDVPGVVPRDRHRAAESPRRCYPSRSFAPPPVQHLAHGGDGQVRYRWDLVAVDGLGLVAPRVLVVERVEGVQLRS